MAPSLIITVVLCAVAGILVGEGIYRLLKPFFHDTNELPSRRRGSTGPLDPTKMKGRSVLYGRIRR